MAARPRTPTRRASSHPPLWLVEGADIVRRKTFLLGLVTGAVVLVVALVSFLAPGFVPPTAAVGAAVGLAAVLMGLAAAVTSDAADLVVRGPRHVAAAGGELVAVLPRDPSVAAAGPLAQAVLEVRQPDVPLLLSFASAGRDARRSAAWTSALARALLVEGVSVLRLDLSSGRSDTPGLVEVIRDGSRLAEVVSFEPGVKLAEMTAGRDHAQALEALTELPARLPRDLDILLVALPSATARTVVSAAASLDHVLVVVERDRTSRVDLIASLEALEAAGTHAQVILLDTPTSTWLAPPVVVPADEEEARPSGLASTIGAAPVLREGSDGEPVPVPEDENAVDESSELEDAAGDEMEDRDVAPAEMEDQDADASEDGAARPEDGAAPPEDGAGPPEDGAGPPEDGAARPEDGAARPEDGAARPEDGAAPPQDGAARTDVVSESDADTGRLLPVDSRDDEQQLRDTAVLDAAAAATALSIAASEQGLTQEQQDLGGPGSPEDASDEAATAIAPPGSAADEPDAPADATPDDEATETTDATPEEEPAAVPPAADDRMGAVLDVHDPSEDAAASLPSQVEPAADPVAPSEVEEPVLEAIEGPLDRPVPDPVPDQEPVIELDLDEGVGSDAPDADPLDGDPLDGDPTDGDPTDDAPSDSDPTDRLAPVRDVGPLAGDDLEAEDLLRTTAQLAILTEDMQARMRAEGDGPDTGEG